MASSGASTEDETLREATLTDRQDVLDLEPDGFDGVDHVPFNYPSFVQGTGVRGYVYEKRGKVAAFLSTKLVDGGQTLFVSAGRVGHQWRGQGLYGRFNKQLVSDWYGKASPELRNISMTINSVGMENFGQRLLRQYRVTTEKTVTGFETEVEEIRTDVKARQNQQHCGLEALTSGDIKSMLTQPPDQLRHLFPEERVVVGMSPYRIMAANADLISQNSNCVFVAEREQLESIKTGDYSSLTLLSCGSHYSCRRGRNYDIDVFGTGSDEDLRIHLEWHLCRLAAVAEEKMAIGKIFYTTNLDGVVAELQKDFSVRHIRFKITKTSTLESDFKK